MLQLVNAGILHYTYLNQWRHRCLASPPSHSAGRPCRGPCSGAESSSDLPGQPRPPGSLSAPPQEAGQGQSAPSSLGRNWDSAHCRCHFHLGSGNPEVCRFRPRCCCRQKCRCRCRQESVMDRRHRHCHLPLRGWTGSLQCLRLLKSGWKKGAVVLVSSWWLWGVDMVYYDTLQIKVQI